MKINIQIVYNHTFTIINKKMKQLNFSIPESEYIKLRELAVKNRISIKDICKGIIITELNKK